MKTSNYIPWATILEEFNENYKPDGHIFFLCNLSPTFKKLWKNEDSKKQICELANEFLVESDVRGVKTFYYEGLYILFSLREVGDLEYEEKISLKNKTRKDFLIWAANKNRKKCLQTT